MNVLLISTYELGRQPFGVASPAAWLKEEGVDVRCLDLAIQQLDRGAVEEADAVCFYVPMHTATRIAVRLAPRVRQINPGAHLCFYGLYAPVNEPLFRSIGAGTVIGGEFEEGLVSMVRRLNAFDSASPEAAQPEPVISLGRQRFIRPDRSGLPTLDKYAYITLAGGDQRVAGYTEASRGCKHLCRHCPVVPVYGGNFRIVPREVILADIEQQVAAGAQHISFGDPDFFNGPGHAIKLVSELHHRWPGLTYDVTIKIEHLLKQADKLPILRTTGCVLVTSAVEAVDERILQILDKRHTREQFSRVVQLCRDADLALNPTFVTFTPWTSLKGYLELLSVLSDLELVNNVSPIQYGIRLLIPSGSRLLELPETREFVQPFDPLALVYPWDHPDPAVDRLHQTVLQIIQVAQGQGASRREIFERVWNATTDEICARNGQEKPVPLQERRFGRPSVPYLSEPWYC
ncbi:CUAEP/CCAEP-tail radical SAM protein [soil metagenome]